MKFSCDRCGQRYSSADEPEPGHSYRILCLACGGMVRLKGGEFPALPTYAADPPATPGRVPPEAGAEEPVFLALAPMAQREPPAASHPRASRSGAPRREVRVRHWRRLAAASGVALATLGAGALLVTGGPRPEPRGGPAAQGTPEATARTGASPAPPPQDRHGAPAVVASLASDSGVPGPDRQAAPSSSTVRTAFPPSARPTQVSSETPAPSLARSMAAAKGPAAVPQEPTAATAPIVRAEPPASARRLTPEEVAVAVAARRPAFEACLEEALQNEPGLLKGGIRVAVVVTVNPIGIATSPQVEEPLLQDTALGGCLRNVARMLLFPAFEGEPFQARIPLVLGK